MKIAKKMAEIHRIIKEEHDDALAEALQRLSFKAILGGINSDDWKKYMCNFASNPKQLQRLIGQDEEFNKKDYGPGALAYLVGNSNCGMGTTTETGRNMNETDPEMLEGLDRDSPEDDQTIDDCRQEDNLVHKYF